ncbi:MAG: DUF1571 domain-containing protein [Planctomycetaceae bacterium]
MPKSTTIGESPQSQFSRPANVSELKGETGGFQSITNSGRLFRSLGERKMQAENNLQADGIGLLFANLPKALQCSRKRCGENVRGRVMRILSVSFPSLSAVMIMAFGGTSSAQENVAAEHPLRPAIRVAQSCLEKVEALPGYEAKFMKREVVGNSLVSHEMKVKIRHQPFSVYLHFENPHAGREVIYVEGQNGGKLLAHEAGLLSIAGTMELLPTDTMAMSENRYPVTMSGIANILKVMIRQWEDETRFGETDVQYFKDAKLGSMTCRVIESRHPQPRREFNNHMIRLWIDTETGIPVRMQKFGFPVKSGDKPPIIEDYVFSDLKTEIRLTDADFDRNNQQYNF